MEIFDKSSFFFVYVRKKLYLCNRKGLDTIGRQLPKTLNRVTAILRGCYFFARCYSYDNKPVSFL